MIMLQAAQSGNFGAVSATMPGGKGSRMHSIASRAEKAPATSVNAPSPRHRRQVIEPMPSHQTAPRTR